MSEYETLDFGEYARVPVTRVPLGYLQFAKKMQGLSRKNREIVKRELQRRSGYSRPTTAQRAVEARETWPCPMSCTPGPSACPLCAPTGGRFDPVILIEARRLRDARRCTQKEAARLLGINPQRLSEIEDGRSLAPDSWGGPEVRKATGLKLIEYLLFLKGV